MVSSFKEMVSFFEELVSAFMEMVSFLRNGIFASASYTGLLGAEAGLRLGSCLHETQRAEYE